MTISTSTIILLTINSPLKYHQFTIYKPSNHHYELWPLPSSVFLGFAGPRPRLSAQEAQCRKWNTPTGQPGDAVWSVPLTFCCLSLLVGWSCEQVVVDSIRTCVCVVLAGSACERKVECCLYSEHFKRSSISIPSPQVLHFGSYQWRFNGRGYDGTLPIIHFGYSVEDNFSTTTKLTFSTWFTDHTCGNWSKHTHTQNTCCTNQHSSLLHQLYIMRPVIATNTIDSTIKLIPVMIPCCCFSIIDHLYTLLLIVRCVGYSHKLAVSTFKWSCLACLRGIMVSQIPVPNGTCERKSLMQAIEFGEFGIDPSSNLPLHIPWVLGWKLSSLVKQQPSEGSTWCALIWETQWEIPASKKTTQIWRKPPRQVFSRSKMWWLVNMDLPWPNDTGSNLTKTVVNGYIAMDWSLLLYLLPIIDPHQSRMHI